MRVLPFKAIYPKKSSISSSAKFFSTAASGFLSHSENDVFAQDEEDSMYVYLIRHHGRKYLGIINNTNISDLTSGKILLHEETIPEKEDDMLASTLERKAMIKPVLLFHKKNEKLNKLITKTIETQVQHYSFELENGSSHQIWKISDQGELESLKNIFLFGVAKAYVADGHHRCKTLLRLNKNRPMAARDLDFSQVLTAYFSEDQVEIYDHVKMVDILEDIGHEEFITELSEYASVSKATKFSYPDKNREFMVLINSEMYKGKWRKKVLKDFEVSPDALDAYLMDEIVFRLILRIQDLRQDPRITYFSGREGAKSILERSTSNPNSIFILQKAPSMDDVKKYSSKKKNLPPKSTWFEPRTKSGIIGQQL